MRPHSLVCLILLAPALAVAAPPIAPGTITYQGALLDATGAPQTGTVDLTFRIYDSIIGGSLVYKQTDLGVPLVDGVFTVQLGPTGDPTDTPVDPLTTSLEAAFAADVGATAPNRFIEVSVGSTSGLGRNPILSVPFAMRSRTADSADVATTALTSEGVGAIDPAIATSIWEHFNFDGGPPNADPSEGTGDTDGDGIENFVDPDNDDDGISDSVEVAQGSDINLVTPTIASLSPASGLFYEPQSVTVSGTTFEASQSTVFDGQAVAPTNLTPTSFDIAFGPAAGPGFADLEVTLANGETVTSASAFEYLDIDYLPSERLTVNVQPGFTFQAVAAGDFLIVSGRTGAYQGFDISGAPSSLFFETISGSTARLAGIDATGRVGGVLQGVVIRLDADADNELEVGEGVAVPTPVSAIPASPSLVFDGSNRPLAGFIADNATTTEARVAYDRNGDGDFNDAAESVLIEPLNERTTDLGRVRLDPAGRVAYAYVDPEGTDRLRIAYDRSGDGDFDDLVGGTPELFTAATQADITDIGLAFDAAGNLLATVCDGVSPPTFLRDLTGDGDFDDAGESQALGAAAADGCDVAGGPELVAVHNGGGTLHLLVDRNGDGDFDDLVEDIDPSNGLTPRAPLAAVRNAAGVIHVVTADDILVDPI